MHHDGIPPDPEAETMPPGSGDAAALEYARQIAQEQDTGPLALPGSCRFRLLADLAEVP